MSTCRIQRSGMPRYRLLERECRVEQEPDAGQHDADDIGDIEHEELGERPAASLAVHAPQGAVQVPRHVKQTDELEDVRNFLERAGEDPALWIPELRDDED